jgi:hypothetical protein
MFITLLIIQNSEIKMYNSKKFSTERSVKKLSQASKNKTYPLIHPPTSTTMYLYKII